MAKTVLIKSSVDPGTLKAPSTRSASTFLNVEEGQIIQEMVLKPSSDLSKDLNRGVLE